MDANAHQPGKNIESSEECQRQYDDAEVTVGGNLKESFYSWVPTGSFAYPQKSGESENSADDRAAGKKDDCERGSRVDEAKSDSYKDGDMNDLVADDIQPFSEKGLLEMKPSEIAVGAINYC